MNLVDKLDEIIKLNNKKLKELRNLRIGSFKFDDYVSRFNMDIENALYLKLQEKNKINHKYNSEISELYDEINEKLTNGDKLVNPFK